MFSILNLYSFQKYSVSLLRSYSRWRSYGNVGAFGNSKYDNKKFVATTSRSPSIKVWYLSAPLRSRSQTNEQFNVFINKLQIMYNNLQRERPYSIIITGDFNRRSAQWWGEDIENLEGTALDELLETNNLFQLVDEPTNMRGDSMSCMYKSCYH